MHTIKNIAIFVSGSGSNAEKIAEHFSSSQVARVSLMLSNRADAYALERAKKLGIDSAVFDKRELCESPRVEGLLSEYRIDYIVLAGFLWLIPQWMVDKYRGRILNIHPALLPAYGGRGMFGDNVHKAVIAAGETLSGITIHKVDEHYDEGDIVFQASTAVETGDTPETLAAKIHTLEHRYFPAVIESEILKFFK